MLQVIQRRLQLADHNGCIGGGAKRLDAVAGVPHGASGSTHVAGDVVVELEHVVSEDAGGLQSLAGDAGVGRPDGDVGGDDALLEHQLVDALPCIGLLDDGIEFAFDGLDTAGEPDLLGSARGEFAVQAVDLLLQLEGGEAQLIDKDGGLGETSVHGFVAAKQLFGDGASSEQLAASRKPTGQGGEEARLPLSLLNGVEGRAVFEQAGELAVELITHLLLLDGETIDLGDGGAVALEDLALLSEGLGMGRDPARVLLIDPALGSQLARSLLLCRHDASVPRRGRRASPGG